MTKWKLSCEELPTQGTKVLCLNAGDVWIAQRFQECWFPIPFLDSNYATYEAPAKWSYIDLPECYSGKMKVRISPKGVLMDMDEFEKNHPKEFIKIKNAMKKEMDAIKKRKNGSPTNS
jgi:hypothetical protein